tara:strand:+ start:3272 stop:3928 length:657 start_codon:yes stop_codon:yes gene_type:complete
MCVNCGVSSCSSCNTDSYIPSNTSALKYDGPKFVCPTNFTVLPGASLNDMLNTLMEQICANSFVHYLGEEFEGGIIYHLYKDSLGVEHGLIVNKAEQGALKWQNIGTATTAVRTEDGVFNTNLMTDSPAEAYVTGLTDGGFSDWYLPSIDESNLLYDNRFNTNKALRSGAFTLLSTATYWSSTELNTGSAYILNSISGVAATLAKDNTTVLTRAIRSF